MKTYLYIDKLGSTLKNIMLEKQEKIFDSQYIIWFKEEFLLNITETGFEKKSCYLLRIAKIDTATVSLTDLPDYKDKYREYKEIKKFFGQSQPQIYHIKQNHFVIVNKKTKIIQLFHLYIDDKQNTKFSQIGKFNINSRIFVDSYLDQFYLIREIDQEFEVTNFFINDFLNQVETVKKSKFQQLFPIIDQINNITLYNEKILLIFLSRQLIILYLNSCTHQIIPILNKKKLYFYPEYQFPDQVLLMIETEKNQLILVQNKIERLSSMNPNFKINLSQITRLNNELISKIFLLDLVKELPNVQEFCLWKSNDFEVVKLLIIGLQSTEEATAAILYSLKYNPINVIGIVKFLDYYCFLREQDFTQLISAIFELIPGYLIKNLSYELQKYPKYIDYLKQYKVIYNNQVSDSKLVWELLCNLTDNHFLKF